MATMIAKPDWMLEQTRTAKRGNGVALYDVRDGFGLLMAEDLERHRAERIVLAVNAHDGLMAALEAAVERMEAVAEEITVEKRHKGVSQATHVSHMAGHLAQHAKIARAALAKASGNDVGSPRNDLGRFADANLDALDRIANGEFAQNVTAAEQVRAMRDVASAALAKARTGKGGEVTTPARVP